MRGRPDVLFIIDQKRELIAVAEAKRVGITTMAIVDTNCDPQDIDYVIPGNDDSIRAIKLITAKIADAILEGKQGQTQATYEEERAHVQETMPLPSLVAAGVHADPGSDEAASASEDKA
jgi:small subunit ribosomal protein S2